MATNANPEGGAYHDDGEEDDPTPKSIASQSHPPSLSSQSSVTSRIADYNFHKILRWLLFVDNNLDSSSVQLLYLGAYSELKNKDSDGIVRASDVYHLLKERSSDDTLVLARFMYGVRKLGKKRRGVYCVDHFKKILKIEPPCIEQYDKDAKFNFYQCLVDICVHLEEDRNISKRVRIYACRHVLGVNPNNIRTVAKVLLMMLKDPKVLSEAHQDQLALVLGQVGASSCLIILQNFRSHYKLGEIDWESVKPHLKTENISPAPSISTLSSNGLRNLRASPSSHVSSGHSSFGSRVNSPHSFSAELHSRNHTQFQDLEYPATEQTALLGAQQELPTQEEIRQRVDPQDQPQVEENKWSCSCKCKVVMIVLGLSIFLAFGLGLSMIVLAALKTSSINRQTLVYENTTTALGNVQKFTTKKVKLYQDPENSEVSLPLKFYHSKESCDSLHPKESVDVIHNETISLHQPQVVVFRGYLLPNSDLNYSICAVTNQLNGSEYHIDFYIAEGLDEDFSFDPVNSNSRYVCHHDIHLVYNPDLQQPNSACFTPITHKLTERGYYTVVLFPPSQNEIPPSNLGVWYSRNDHLKVIDTSRLQLTCSKSSGNKTDPCEISIGSGQHTISTFCVVVEVGTSKYDPFTHIHVKLEDWDAGEIWFYSLGGFITAVAFFLSLFILILVVYLYKCTN